MKVVFTLSVTIVTMGMFIFTLVRAGSTEGPNWTLTLLRLGAQYNPLALDGEWYRIFAHIFLHGSIAHLLVSTYLLLYTGVVMEPKVGTKKFAFVFFVSGVAAAFSGLYWNLFTIGVGTAGAISGLLGFMLVYNIFYSGKNGKPMLVLLMHFVAFAAVNILFPEQLYPDYAAQFGGVIAGIVIGFFSFAPRRREAASRVRIEYLLMGLLLSLYFMLPRNQVRYFKFFRQVVAAEDTTKHLLKEKLTDDDMRTFIRNYHHWDEILGRLNDQTNLPAGLGSDTFKLRQYIGLRKQENLYKKMVVQHETYTYLDSVERLQEVMQQYLQLDYGLWSRIKLKPDVFDSSSLSRMVKVLYDSDGVEIQDGRVAYTRIGFRDSLGRWDGMVREYYADGDIRMKGRYRRNKRDGVFLFYTDHRTYKEAGRFLDDKRFGKWQTFHDNGRLAAEIVYNNGRFVHSMWDSLGNRMVVDGNGREIQRYPNGVVAVEGEYHHGVKEGYWYGRHPTGELYFEEIFNGGRLISGKSRTPEGQTFVYDESSLFPMPEGGFPKFHRYVKSQTRKVGPDEMGHVKLSFRVSPRGALTDMNIVQGATPFLDAKAKEILVNGPRWMAPRLHGHEPVEGIMELIIEFY